MADGGTHLLGTGIYTLPQAARLAKVPPSSIHRWVYGYKYNYGGNEVRRPAFVAANADLREARVITFRDLIEIQFVHVFRSAGVSWNTIREAAANAKEITRDDHPFANSRFVTDGREIFAEIAQKSGNRELLNVCSNQMAFRQVLLPSLKKKLDLGEAGIERFWPMGKRNPVVLDPTRQFGQPIVEVEGVPTAVLAKAYEAMQSFSGVSKWYAVDERRVRKAIDFELQHAA